MVQPISQRTCPKCLDDAIEKVGWNYWYCNSCTNIWEIVASAGKRIVTQYGTADSPSVPRAKENPDPGTMEPVPDLDYPLL